MRLSSIAIRLAALGAVSVLLSGCLVMSVAGAAVGVAGTAVKVTGKAVVLTAKGVGAVVGGAIGEQKPDKD